MAVFWPVFYVWKQEGWWEAWQNYKPNRLGKCGRRELAIMPSLRGRAVPWHCEELLSVAWYGWICFCTYKKHSGTDDVRKGVFVLWSRLIQPSTGRPKKFCSDKCRREWWKAHPEKLHRKDTAIYTMTCARCGKEFTSYGNKNRKYCSHDCYIKARFWEGLEDGVQKAAD